MNVLFRGIYYMSVLLRDICFLLESMFLRGICYTLLRVICCMSEFLSLKISAVLVCIN